jgi:hypothetical protein
MQSVYCVYSILTNIKITRKFLIKFPNFSLSVALGFWYMHMSMDGWADGQTNITFLIGHQQGF